jgi:hypothetical protein
MSVRCFEVLFVALRDPSREVIQEAVTGLLPSRPGRRTGLPAPGVDALITGLKNSAGEVVQRAAEALTSRADQSCLLVPRLLAVWADPALLEQTRFAVAIGCRSGCVPGR